MPFKQSHILTVYQTHDFANLHKQIKDWLRFKSLLNSIWNKTDWTAVAFFWSSWCFWQPFFWQVMQMHFKVWARLLEIKFERIIWFDIKKVTFTIANWIKNQPMIKQKMKFNLHLLPTPLIGLRQSMASTPFLHIWASQCQTIWGSQWHESRSH